MSSKHPMFSLMGSQGVHGLLEATGLLGPTVAGRVFVKGFRDSSEMVIRMGGNLVNVGCGPFPVTVANKGL